MIFKKYILNQYFFNLKNLLIKKNSSKELCENGYIQIKKKIFISKFKLSKILKFQRFQFCSSYKKDR